MIGLKGMVIAGVAGAAIVGVMALNTVRLETALEDARTEAATLQSANEANLTAIGELRGQIQRNARINAELSRTKRQLNQQLAESRRETRAAIATLSQAERDCALSPVPAAFLRAPSDSSADPGDSGMPGSAFDGADAAPAGAGPGVDLDRP